MGDSVGPRGRTGQACRPVPAAKKEYRVDPADPTHKKYYGAVQEMLRKAQFPQDGQKIANLLYRGYQLAELTSTDEKNLATLPDSRAKILRGLKTHSRTGGEVYVYVRDQIILDYMNDIASKPNDKGLFCHPSVRVNAMLLIGELNEKDWFVGGEIPVPLSAAVPVLVVAIESPDQIDAVRVAAMAGLYRHVRLGGIATPEAKKLVGVAMYKLLKTTKPPADRTPEGHAWMRGQAAGILGEIGMAGAKGVVAEAIAATAADDAILFSARCTAARALGKLKYAAAGEFDPTPLALRPGPTGDRRLRRQSRP